MSKNLKMEDKIEQASEIIHELWMGWAKEMLDKEPHISDERRDRWTKECFIPYSELSEDMKELDRRFARKFQNLYLGN